MVVQSSELKSQNYNFKIKTNLRERSFLFSIQLIKFIQTLPEKKIYWILTDQLLRAGTSVGANIIEAKASSSKKDFIKFYDIALKSANETLYWLELLHKSALAAESEIQPLFQEMTEISRMLGSSLITLKNKKF